MLYKNSQDDFRIIYKEKDKGLMRLKESIFINHLIINHKLSLNTKEGNAELVLFIQCYKLFGV